MQNAAFDSTSGRPAEKIVRNRLNAMKIPTPDQAHATGMDLVLASGPP